MSAAALLTGTVVNRVGVQGAVGVPDECVSPATERSAPARPDHPLPMRLAALPPAPVAAQLTQLHATGHTALPRPGQGQTLVRWQALAAVAAYGVALSRLFEGHADARAILAELAPSMTPPDGLTGVWAAEAPGTAVHWRGPEQGTVLLASPAALAPRGSARVTPVRVSGSKAWCSGAGTLDHALLTARRDPRQTAVDGATPPAGEGGPGPASLVLVDLQAGGVRIDRQSWQAIGMAETDSFTVHFDDARGVLVGEPGDYLARAGFWHGGAGVAACWFGAATGVAEALHAKAHAAQAAGGTPDPFLLAALGTVDASLAGAGALLRDTAAWIDTHPQADASLRAIRVRALAERVAREVIDVATRALGAGPLCKDPAFARRVADLSVYLRQWHGERDMAALGLRAAQAAEAAWKL